MSYTAVLEARRDAESKLTTLRQAIQRRNERLAKSEEKAKDDQQHPKQKEVGR